LAKKFAINMKKAEEFAITLPHNKKERKKEDEKTS